MSTHKHFDRLCLIVLAVTLLLGLLLPAAGSRAVPTASAAMGYESLLFDSSSVHTVEIVMDDWEGFLETCTNEEYTSCAVLIDGEAYRNVGLRAKGNTSLTQVAAYGSSRYSFKIEFDHYDSAKTYHGLDKLCLNNIIQDNTYMKEFFSYRIMAEAGAAAPLCSYVNISVNGEPWGLYLAVEGIEESFLRRNYGSDYGRLYKPDSMDMGGGDANGAGGTPGRQGQTEPPSAGQDNVPAGKGREGMLGGRTEWPSGEQEDTPAGKDPEDIPGGRAGGRSLMGDSDVLLQYTDDDADSYPNLFDNAKTDVSEADKSRLIEALRKLSDGEDPEEAVDTDSVIRYFTAHNFVLNFDSYTGSMIHNYYLYEEDGLLSMLPWDYNLAFGGFESADGAESLVNHPIDTPVSGGSIEDRPMLAWIFSDETYLSRYHQYFSELLSGYFESGRFAAEMDLVTAMISPYVEEDPTKFCTLEEFETGAKTLKEFCLLRAKSIREQLDGSIGRTADTQEADTLVGAEGLEISDMGSMGGNGMRGGGEVPAGIPGGADIPSAAGEGGLSDIPAGDSSPAVEAQGRP
ncbi:MAG: spore coat protein CotH, partial [Lachnospiraceae bacterium]|nr:spore coat protein CotH [Lachnospiraceae bacterium]